MFVDLDADEATGGRPAELGLPAAAAGIDLVTSVEVNVGVHEKRLTPRAWLSENGTFQEIAREELSADIQVQIDAETGDPVSTSVHLVMPLEVRGDRGDETRFQAVARDLSDDGDQDRLPDDPLDVSPARLVPPIYPGIVIDPPQVRPGDTIQITVDGLVPNATAKVLLGETLIVMEPLDDDGNGTFEVTVPEDAVEGPRLVTVGVEGTALTADGTVFVDQSVRPGSILDLWWVGVALLLAIVIVLIIIWTRKRTPQATQNS